MERYHLIEGVGVHYVTFTVVEWLPIFIDEQPCKIITDSLNYCVDAKNLRVTAYVLMPNHLHAVLFDKDFDNNRLKLTLNDMRKFTGRQLAEYCDRKLPRGMVDTLYNLSGTDRQRRFWQPTLHPIGLVTEKVFLQKVNYIHWNPCRKGLVRQPENWRFSSAGFWTNGLKNDVELVGVWW